MAEVVLCGDIGGTNTSLSVVSIGDGKPEILLLREYSTADILKIESLVNDFLSDDKVKAYGCTRACFSVAGPVKDGKYVKLTNANLCVDGVKLVESTCLEDALIINDFEAIAYAINVINDEDLHFLRKLPSNNGTKALIGAGTGLGMGFVYFDGRAYSHLPSEGAHINFPVENRFDLSVAEFIKREKNRNSFPEAEDVVSGRGIELIYRFLQDGYGDCPKDINSIDILKNKYENECAMKTYNYFKSYYARVCRNLALISLSTGGLYIAGGIAAGNHDIFDDDFLEEFLDHDRLRCVLEEIPLCVIKDYHVSHYGAAYAIAINKNR